MMFTLSRYHIHEDEVDTMCMECERFFEDQRALQRHIKVHSPDLLICKPLTHFYCRTV